MPIPPVLTNPVLYGRCWTGLLPVGANVLNPGRGPVSKNFIAYVENYEQSAHDSTIAAYIKRLGGGSRSPHRAQVKPANTNAASPLLYYATHGQVASGLAAVELQRSWQQAADAAAAAAEKAKAKAKPGTPPPPPPPPVTVFTVGGSKTLAVQGVRQPNGFHYEVTLWYDTQDIYVAFHCYAP